MKIAVFTDTYYPKIDGIVTSIMNSTESLARKNHHIIIFAPTYKEKKDNKLPSNIKVYRFFSLSLFSYKEVKIPIPNISKVFTIIKEFSPDIIHIHAPGTMGLLGVICSKLFDIPCIGTYHTLVSEQIMYLSFRKLTKLDKLVDKIRNNKNFNKKKPSKVNIDSLLKNENIKKIIDIISLKKIRDKEIGKEMIWNISCNLYNKCDIVTVPSRSIKKALIKHKVTKPIVVLSNGVDLKRFIPKKDYIIKERTNLLHVGRISFEKNIHEIINVFHDLLKERSNVTLTIVGDGPALDNLKSQAKSLNVSSKINFTGILMGENLVKSYHEGDIFITTSPMETQGLVVLEAMSCGLPVIGIDRYAIPDLVKHGINGFIAKDPNIRTLKRYCLKLMDNPDLIRQFGEESVRLAKKHELNKVISDLESLYLKASGL